MRMSKHNRHQQIPQPAKQPNETSQPPADDSAGRHWIHNLLIKEGKVIKGAPLSFLVCVLVLSGFLCAGAYWLVDHFYAAESRGKDATIQSTTQERDKYERENQDKQKIIDDLKIYRGKDALPLKKTALILASQINDFLKNCKDTDAPDVKYHTMGRFNERFYQRITLIRDDLDMNGQHSDTLDKIIRDWPYGNTMYNDLKTLSSEIEKLANGLPD